VKHFQNVGFYLLRFNTFISFSTFNSQCDKIASSCGKHGAMHRKIKNRLITFIAGKETKKTGDMMKKITRKIEQ
jgi:hypothetical protein